jgi:hypothetical protein
MKMVGTREETAVQRSQQNIIFWTQQLWFCHTPEQPKQQQAAKELDASYRSKQLAHEKTAAK